MSLGGVVGHGGCSGVGGGVMEAVVVDIVVARRVVAVLFCEGTNSV